MRVPIMRPRSGGPEFVLECSVAVNRALRDQRDSVHVGRFVLWLSAPVDRQTVAWDFVDDVHHEDVVLADLDRRTWKLSVGGDYSSDCTVCAGAMGVVAMG